MAKWRTVRLGEVCRFRYGDMPKKSDLTTEGYPVYSGYRLVGYASRYHYREPEIIVVARGVGGTGDIKMTPPFCFLTNLSIAILLETPEVFKPFLYYQLSATTLWELRTGSAQAQITIERLKDYEVALPPLPLQRRIAGILSAYDELIKNSQRRIRILEEMARALYRDWFVHFRFPGREKLPRVASPFGDIPLGWEVKPFSALASYVNGYAFKPDDWGAEGKPIVKIKELKAGITSDTPRNSGDGIPAKYNVRDGDVLFSWSADLDTYLWMGGEGLLNQHLFNVVPFDGLSHAFCLHALKESMPRFRALSLGATMQHIKRSALDQVFTVVPSAALRKRFDVLVEPMHRQIITLAKHVQNLRWTRDLLLPRLLSGQMELTSKESHVNA